MHKATMIRTPKKEAISKINQQELSARSDEYWNFVEMEEYEIGINNEDLDCNKESAPPCPCRKN